LVGLRLAHERALTLCIFRGILEPTSTNCPGHHDTPDCLQPQCERSDQWTQAVGKDEDFTGVDEFIIPQSDQSGYISFCLELGSSLWIRTCWTLAIPLTCFLRSQLFPSDLATGLKHKLA